MEGYIKLWRVLLEKPIWRQSTPEQRSVLITLLLMANHEENEWEWQGEKFKVGPGQFVTSLENIRKLSGAGTSTQNVRSSLARFEKLEFLTNKSTKSGRLITICNWSEYQPRLAATQQSHQQRGNKGATPNKNDKNDKKYKEPSASGDAEQAFYLTKKKRRMNGKRLETFLRFWSAFDYKHGKAEAADAWLDIPTLTDTLVTQIVEAAKQTARKRPQLIADGNTPKMAQGWISGRRWEDEHGGLEKKVSKPDQSWRKQLPEIFEQPDFIDRERS